MSNQDNNPELNGQPQQPQEPQQVSQPTPPQQAQQPNGYQQQPNGYQQQPNGYQQQPNGYQQQPNGYQQQPNGYQQNGYQQQPNGYQQNGYQQPNYQQAPQQPYGYQQAPQQPYYQPQPQVVVVQQQPVSPVSAPASEGEKDAVFSIAGSIMMIILCVLGTIDLIVTIFKGLPLSLIQCILPIFMVIGLWLTFAAGKQKKLSPLGLKFVRVPFVIQFVFKVIVYVFMLILAIIGLAAAVAAVHAIESEVNGTGVATASTAIIFGIGLAFILIVFIFNIIYFRSINKCLKGGISILSGKTAGENVAGTFAAVIMFIQAFLDFLPSLVIGIVALSNSALVDQVFDTLNISALSSIKDAIVSSAIAMIIGGLLSVIYQVLAGVLILQYVGKLKKAYNN